MPVQRDLYEVLGVSRDANADEIRRAYRRLARQHHPDVNGGSAESVERFKEINQAYEVLSNDEKRARYDRFGMGGVDGSGGEGMGGAGFGPFTDIFDVFFSGMGGTRTGGPEPGADLRVDLEVTLEEVLHGAEKSFNVTRMEACGDCSGSGARSGTRVDTCVQCAGSGYVQTRRQTMFGTMSQVAECPRCRGRGKTVTEPCTRCSGRGLERQTRKITLQVPPGVDERTRFRRTGDGEAGPWGGPPGDLYIFIHVKPHPIFRRQGRDLINEVKVSFARAALGGEVEVPTLEGTETHTIPAGTQPDTVFSIRGKGLPEYGRSTRGDQHVIIKVQTPTQLNERQRKALEEFAEASGEDLSATETASRAGGLLGWVQGLFQHHKDED